MDFEFSKSLVGCLCGSQSSIYDLGQDYCASGIKDRHTKGYHSLLEAMALHGEKAHRREVMSDARLCGELKRALAAVLQSSSSILDTEGHRSQIRLRGHASSWHFGSAHLFITPNLADSRSPFFLQSHLQGL